jgi:hypothetical protein
VDGIDLKLPGGETLSLSRDDARRMAQRLWESAHYPGAAPMAVKISETVSASPALRRPIEITEREYGALARLLADEELNPAPGP